MISFRNVWYDDPLSEARIENVSFDLLSHEHHALFCQSAAERMALVKLISGSRKPDRGEVFLPPSMSFPVASIKLIQSRFTVRNNIKLLSRLYGLRASELEDFVSDMVGPMSYSPSVLLKMLPRDERSAISLALSYGIPFNCYVAETFALPLNDGGAAFNNLQTCLRRFAFEKRGLVLITGAPARARDACSSASILKSDELVHYDNIAQGIKAFRELTKIEKNKSANKELE